MSVALPNLMTTFAVSAASAQWLTTGFMLTMAVVIPTTGLILQRFTTRAVFIASVSLFAAGTALAAVAPIFSVLVAARVIQASGTAIMLPLLMTTVLTFVPASHRGRAMGLISIVISVAPAIGPTYSGFILSTLGWRWMFFTVLPIAVVCLILGAVRIKNLTTPKKVRFDLTSILLSAFTFGGLIYGLSSFGAASEGSVPVSPIVPIAVGAVTGVLFVWRQLRLQRDDAALLDLRPLRERTFVVSVAILLVSMGALFGTLILLPIYLQNVLGLSTLHTGLVLLPGGLAMGLIAPIVGRVYDRVGPRPLVIPGTFSVALALGLTSLLGPDSPTSLAVLIHVLLSLGLGCVMTPLMTSALGSLTPDLYSHGSAILNTLQQLAGAVGTALFITIMTTHTARSIAGGTPPLVAQAGGVHEAFLWGTGLALAAAGLSFFMRGHEPAAPLPRP